MHKNKLMGLATAATMAVSAISLSTAAQAASPEMLAAVQDSYIVVFNSNVKSTEAKGRAAALVSQAGGQLGHVYSTALRGFSVKMSAKAAEQMAKRADVAYVEADGIASIDAKPVGPISTAATQITPWGITRVGGSSTAFSGTAWVIDTGIDTDNADLNIDLARSANFVSRGRNTIEDGHGHGTHVSGTIAALDNAIDVVGVAPGALVVGVRVLDNRGSGLISGIVAGVDYVAANAASGDVANMSLGGSGHWASLHDAIVATAAGGVKFALAAGNDTDDANNYEPAHVEATNVWTVSATDINDVFASFSNFANPPVDFAAPGVNVASLAPGGGYVFWNGTSMATPHVAGLLMFGNVNSDGTAINDPDGNPDPIAHR